MWYYRHERLNSRISITIYNS
ncbi:hypothetical protein MTR67_040156 [Solanum verrucosum]|uniref:Uncharacterized protein n=1 Tax=Solanum verrucosum TaxID=315347 RepID=A0AAF0ZPI6_SOLVR|nr:hypothetical protein MTR67_040156 [Solanum verrucosum]